MTFLQMEKLSVWEKYVSYFQSYFTFFVGILWQSANMMISHTNDQQNDLKIATLLAFSPNSLQTRKWGGGKPITLDGIKVINTTLKCL